MSALPLGRYRQLLHQLLQLNEQAAALRRELNSFVDTGLVADQEGAASGPGPESAVPQSPEGASPHLQEIGHLDDNPPKEMIAADSPTSKVVEASSHSIDDAESPAPLSNGGESEAPVTRQNSQHSSTSRLLDDSDAPSSESKKSSANGAQQSAPSRKPHFLDDDYHLKSNGSTPQLHFLDSSPSPSPVDEGTSAHAAFALAAREDAKKGGSVASKSATSNSRVDEFGESSSYGAKAPEEHAGKRPRPKNEYDCPWQVEREAWQNQDSCSVKSFSSVGSGNASSQMGNLPQQLEQKVDSVYQLLSLLSLSADCNADMSEYLLEISNDIESCITMRQSGCIPLLVRLIHSKHSRASKRKATRALHNLIHAQPDNKAGRREVRVLRLLETVREYCLMLEDAIVGKGDSASVDDDMSKHPVPSVAALMKLSFDEEHRHVMCQLGGLQSLATLVTVDQSAHGSLVEDAQCVTMRKYSGMALTNLTFGDGNNKALLCSFKDFMMALVDQLQSPNEDMRQVTAAVLRNLSWRADSASKQILREVGAVKGLTLAAMSGHTEATLKSVLSALWNLTAHCSLNKIDICSVDGALAFLVKMLSFDAPSKTLAIVENAGGILRNVSSHIAVREDYRQILREHNCLKVLLEQLKSPSLTIVSNSCGTLWNLSARCQEDQQYLWDNGAVPMLRSLIHSKHKMIAMGSSAALKNLLNSKPGKDHPKSLDGTCRDLNLPLLPTLGARKQRALEQEIDQNLSETCENIEPTTSPTTNNRDEKLILSAAEKHLAFSLEKRRMSSSSPLMGPLASQLSLSHSGNFSNYSNLLQNNLVKGFLPKPLRTANVNRSDSKDSVTSTHSDSVYERAARNSKYPNYFDYSNQQGKVEKGSDSVDNMKLYKNGNGEVASNSRNNFSETNYDIEQFGCDQPIDYSQKYSETKSTLHESFHGSGKTVDIDVQNAVVAYGDYQETDLDQPTDYSLRYAEDVPAISDGQVIPVNEDTIKHFCTEGTPYETPINFSTATSMSDLRAISNGPGLDKSNSKNEVELAATMTLKETTNAMSQSNEKDTCSIEDNTKLNCESSQKSKNEAIEASANNAVYNSKFSSGLLSPEKPTNYCEEGTPGYFSRVSSLSSLDEIGDKKENEKEEFESKDGVAGCQIEKASENLLDTPANMNCAEETPLMFSRCSSLGSISECSVPEQADDVGSVVSEFSRLTSGCISPSELPDSPTQSPVTKIDSSNLHVPPIRITKIIKTPQQNNRLRSVFEDEVSAFHCEHTPVEFSTGTSLSSLTIDDEPKIKFRPFDMVSRSEGVGCSNPSEIPNNFETDSKINISESLNDSELESENILAMCIDAGVQSSIKPKSSKVSLSSPVHTGNHIESSSILNDACHTYCTEDTPAIMSKVGSQSNLSELSFLDMENDSNAAISAKQNSKTNSSIKKDYSDDSSNLSGDSDNLLAECIRSGMPKASSRTLYSTPGDELKKYAVEGTPFRHSACSSLSDLTIESKENNLESCKTIKTDALQFKVRQESLNGSVSSIELGSDDGHVLNLAIRAGVPQQNGSNSNPKKKEGNESSILDIGNLNLNDRNDSSNLKRNDSISSLSDDSLGSNDGEQALFEECIKSGMPRGNLNNWNNTQTLDKNFKSRFSEQFKMGSLKSSSRKNKSLDKIDNDHDPEFESLVNAGAFGACSKKFSKTDENIHGKLVSLNDHRNEIDDRIISADTENKNENSFNIDDSKNVQVPSVAANNQIGSQTKVNPPTAASDVKIPAVVKSTEIAERNAPSVNPRATNETVPSNGPTISSMMTTKNGYNTADTTDSVSDEGFTAAENIQCRKSFINLKDSDIAMKESTTEGGSNSSCEKPIKHSTDTWDDNTCPTDVDFPTISGSVPLIASFKSENGDEITCNNALPDLLEESIVYNETCNQPDLTDKLLESADDSLRNIRENDKFTSMSSSTMIENEAARLALLVSKTTFEDSIFSLNNQSLELENIKPPSQMGSLVSLTQSFSGNWIDGENHDGEKFQTKKNILNTSRRKSLPHGIMARKALGIPLHNQGHSESADNSFSSNLENIKPPADLNETYDMENSMFSVASIVSEMAESRDDKNMGFHFDLKQPVNTLNLSNFECHSIIDNVNPPSLFDELSESTLDHNSESINGFSMTLLQNSISEKPFSRGEFSESSIQKEATSKKYLTPKQKRQMSKERYKTYVIMAEAAKDVEDKGASPVFEINDKSSTPESRSSPIDKCTLSPKQKRQEDRMRYQTQTVKISDLNSIMKNMPNCENSKKKKSPKQRRVENIERYQTRILETNVSSSNSSGSQENMLESDSSTVVLENSSDDYHAQLVKDATKAFDLLQKQTIEDSSFLDLDCETMSLISEDDAELNSLRMRTFTKSFRNYLPVIESPTAVDKCIVQNLKNMSISGNLNIESEACEQQLDTEPNAGNNFNSFECDQNSGTESADQNQYSDYELEKLGREPVKPKITKPHSGLKNKNSGSGGSLNSDETPKALRGRKKVYVSPYKRDANVKRGTVKTNSTLKYSKATNITATKVSNGLSTKGQQVLKKPVNLVTKTSTPLKTVEKHQKLGKESPNNKQTSAKAEIKPQPLVRQGTFVKEESTVLSVNDIDDDICSATSPSNNSKLAKPASVTKTSPSKLPLHQKSSAIPSSISKVKTADAATKSGIPNLKCSQSKLKCSSSNQSLQSNESGKTITLSVKSKSDAKASNESVNSIKLSTKNITSKVSSLWKKVEESKKLQAKPDTRVWIKCDTKDAPSDSSKGLKLIRSSTFEGPSKTIVNAPPKQKSSINLKVSQLPVCKYTSKVPVKSSLKPTGL